VAERAHNWRPATWARSVQILEQDAAAHQHFILGTSKFIDSNQPCGGNKMSATAVAIHVTGSPTSAGNVFDQTEKLDVTPE
jgi:hypothetical protein